MYQSLLKDSHRPTLIFLHGWAGSWQTWHPILERLKDSYNLFAIKLPYPTDKALNLDDYCQFVLNFIEKEKLDHPVIIGHSLGGAIAIKIAAEHPDTVSSIVLASAAAIRHPLPKLWRFLQTVIVPFKPALKSIRHLVYKLPPLNTSDYQVLTTSIEKTTFQNLITADLTNQLPQISCPTLILWGDEDSSTPLTDGLKIHSLIPQSTFYSFPNSGHFFFLDYQQEFSQKIIDFVTYET